MHDPLNVRLIGSYQQRFNLPRRPWRR